MKYNGEDCDDEEETTLCDNCGREVPADETHTCRCGAQTCNDCDRSDDVVQYCVDCQP